LAFFITGCLVKRSASASGAQHAIGRALAVVNLYLLAGRKLQAVELFGLAPAQFGGKALDGVVGRCP